MRTIKRIAFLDPRALTRHPHFTLIYFLMSFHICRARVSGSGTGKPVQGFRDDDLLNRAVPAAISILILGIGAVKHSYKVLSGGTVRRWTSRKVVGGQDVDA